VPDRTAPLFAADGTRKGDYELDGGVFGIEPNLAVLHQVVTAQLAAARSGTASTQTRADAAGGGKKPWRQKGLGRARHGSIRAPQWRGGGVAHGPHPRDYSERTPKKMRRLALHSALSARASESAVSVWEVPGWDVPKTKQAKQILSAVGAEGKVLLVLGHLDSTVGRSFRNLPNVVMSEPGQLTAYDVLWAASVVFTADSIGRMSGSKTYEVSKSDFVKEEGS
jgi:large subunit ribosomal protein L4